MSNDDLGDPYEGVAPNLAWMLRVLSDEFGMLGVLETQQAAFDYVGSGGAVRHRLSDMDKWRAFLATDPTLSEAQAKAREMGLRLDAALTPKDEPEPCTDEREDWTEVRVKEETQVPEFDLSTPAGRLAFQSWAARPGQDVRREPLQEGEHPGPRGREKMWKPAEETSGEVLARLGTDAQKWAREFVTMFNNRTIGWTVNEDLLLTWFATSIGAGETKNAVALDYLRHLVGPDWREKAQAWFEKHYSSETAEGDNVLDELKARIARLRDGYTGLRDQIADPPKGWFTFGTHAAHDDVRLEFWGADESGTPLWERPDVWKEAPLDAELAPDETIRLIIVGDAGDGWDGNTKPHAFVWDKGHDVTLEVRRKTALTGVVSPPQENNGSICHRSPMESICSACGHTADVHRESGPCTMCVAVARMRGAM